jgi:hypothetical protein
VLPLTSRVAKLAWSFCRRGEYNVTAAILRDGFHGLVREKRALLGATEGRMAGHALGVEAIDHLYESTFLEVVTRFEAFLEDLFYEVALGSSSIFRTGAIGAVAGVHSRDDLEATLVSSSNLDYLNWLPIDRTIDRAAVVLRDGRPFSRLDRRFSEKAVLKEVSTIRNAVAHRSGTAWTNFGKLVPDSLPAARRHPAGLLQMTVGLSTKYNSLCDGLAGVVSALAARSDAQAWRLLSPEAERQAGKLAPAGSYECVSCGTVSTRTAGPLSPCANCHTGPCLICGTEKQSRLRRTGP